MTSLKKHGVYVSAFLPAAYRCPPSLDLPSRAIVTLCIFSPADTWIAQATTGEKPPALWGHTLTKIDQHRAGLFGGFDGGRDHNDTFILDMETWV